MSHKPGGRLPLLSARPAVTPATLKRAASRLRFEPGPFCARVQHANHSATEPPEIHVLWTNLHSFVAGRGVCFGLGTRQLRLASDYICYRFSASCPPPCSPPSSSAFIWETAWSECFDLARVSATPRPPCTYTSLSCPRCTPVGLQIDFARRHRHSNRLRVFSTLTATRAWPRGKVGRRVEKVPTRLWRDLYSWLSVFPTYCSVYDGEE